MAVNEGNIHYVEFRGDTSQLRKEIDLLSAKLNTLSKNTSVQTTSIANNTKKMSTSMASSFLSLRNVLAGAGIALGLQQIGRAFTSMVGASSELENIRTTFRVFTGSVELADKTLADLKTTALESPLNFQDFIQGAKTLLGYGVSASQVTDVVKMLGDVSGGSADRFQRLSLAFGQVVGAGRLMGQEARQMINAGFNPLQFIAEKTGKSMAQLQDEMRKGQISVQDVADAFKIATGEGGRFYGLSQEITNTLGGQFNKLKESLFFTFAEIGDELSKTFDFKGVINGITEAINLIKPSIIELFRTIGDSMIFKVLSNLLSLLPGLIKYIIDLGTALFKVVDGFYKIVTSGVTSFFEGVNWVVKESVSLLDDTVTSLSKLNLGLDDLEDHDVSNTVLSPDQLKTFEKNAKLLDTALKQGKTIGEIGKGDNNLKDLLTFANANFKTLAPLVEETTKKIEEFNSSTKVSPEIKDTSAEKNAKKFIEAFKKAYKQVEKDRKTALKEILDFTKFTNDRLLEESFGAQGKQVLELTRYFDKVKDLYAKNNLDVLILNESLYKQATKIQSDFAEKRIEDLKNMMNKSIETFQKGMKDMQEGFNLSTSGGIKGFLDGLKDPDPLGTFFVNAFANATAFAESVPSLIGQGFGEIISGTVNFGEGMRRIGNSVLGALGDFVKGLGEQLIKFGIASSGIQAALASILTPAGAAAAIGIGTILVALGSAMKNASQSQGQSVGGNARPSRVSATPVGRTSSKNMQTGNTYQYGGATFSTQSIKLSIDLTGSITASPTGYNISKQYETIARVTGR